MRRLLVLVLVLLSACKPSPKDTGPGDSGDLRYPQFCDAPMAESATEATVGILGGRYLGYYDIEVGSLSTMKFIPEHLFHLETLQLGLAGESGTARIRITEAWGNSYPDFDNVEGPDVTDPIDITVEMTDDLMTYDVDVSDRDIWLEPTQQYVVSYELKDGLQLAIEATTTGDWSHALLFIYPDMVNAYGVDGNFRIQLLGEYACAWPDEERWFGKDMAQPWEEVASARVAVADVDGDAHDDIVVNDGSPRLYLGDGAGGFAEPAVSPWPQTTSSSMLVFGDVDNDGDQDAFGAWYIGWDSDGDNVKIDEGDCNDVDASIAPGEDEVPDDSKDNNCDGITDDGAATWDDDRDGVALPTDCNDTDAGIYPGAPEVLDGRDNDCDLLPDEGFSNRILLNDGTGQFTILEGSGVETREPTTAASMGDTNNDGFLDIYWGNWLITYPEDAAVQDRFMVGNGDGTFTDATESAGLILDSPYSCYGVEMNDWDNDGLADILVGNYHLYPNHLWHNNGDGTFADVAEDVGVAFDDIPYEGFPPIYKGGHSYGADFGDIDNDGDLDLFQTNLSHPRTQPWADPSMFGVNQGAPDWTFDEQRAELGIPYDEGDVNAAFADFDHDMDLDLAIASLYTDHYARLYRNDGGHFTDVSYEAGISVEDAVSVTWSDVDEDGDLDLWLADRHLAPYVHLYTNRVGTENGWVQLDLQGTTVNRDAAGARITLTAGGVTQTRDLWDGGGQSNVQMTHIVHFGLGAHTTIDDVTVYWPGGASESVTGLEPNHRYKVVQGQGATEVF